MRTSLPYHDKPVRVPENDQFTERLRGLNPQQILDALTFVAFWSPGTFTAALDYCEATGWGQSGSGPDPAPGQDGDDDTGHDPAPVCAQCGGNLGIFLKLGLEWRHYHGEDLNDIELYDPGHAPEITWRIPATARTPAFAARTAP
jgi:hypothetical protein